MTRLFVGPVVALALAASASAQTLSYADAVFDGDLMPPGALNRAQAVAVSPDGRHVYVAADTTPALGVFEIDAAADHLTLVETELVPADPASVAVSADGGHVYVATTVPGAVTWFDRDPISGALSNPGSIATGDPGVMGLAGARSLALSPDDQNVYVASPSEDALAVFSRNPADGALTFLEAHLQAAVPALIDPWEVEVSPDGGHVYAATLDTGLTGVGFTRGPTGALSDPQSIAPNIVDGWSKSLVFSPGGDQVYFGGGNPNPPQDHAILIYDRDPGTGALNFAELLDDSEVPDPPGLATISSLAMAPDGTNVLVALDSADAVVALTRDAEGDLSYLDAVIDGPASDGLEGATSVAIAPNGRFTVAAGKSDAALVLLAPEPSALQTGLAALSALLGLGALPGKRRPSATPYGPKRTS